MLNVGILGYGGIARAHRKGYEVLDKQGAPVKLTALCDVDPGRFTRSVAINQGGGTADSLANYNTYTSLDDMLTHEKLDVVDICLPTYLHCEYAVKLLKMGYHVQSEKPMGLNSAQCEQMLQAARESGKKLMIGMCLRFDPGYLLLKQYVDEGTYGKVKSAHFDRLSPLPTWGYENWFMDYKRSGGCVLDMHIHDVDMIRFLFGDPQAVSARKSDFQMPYSAVNSQFIYPDKLVSAVGDWSFPKSFKFKSGFRVNFERAAVVMEKGVITVCPEGGDAFCPPVEEKNYMAEESLYLAKTILGEQENVKNDPADAAATVRLVEKLVKSAENGGVIVEV